MALRHIQAFGGVRMRKLTDAGIDKADFYDVMKQCKINARLELTALLYLESAELLKELSEFQHRSDKFSIRLESGYENSWAE